MIMSSLDNLRAGASLYPRTDNVPERQGLATGAHNLLSRQDASTADHPNKDGPCCLGHCPPVRSNDLKLGLSK